MQRPLFGQSASGWPTLQQVETLPTYKKKNKKVEMNFENLNVKYLQDSCLHLLLLLCHPLLLCPLLRSLLHQHHILHLCFILYTRVFIVSTHPRLLRTDYSWPIASS